MVGDYMKPYLEPMNSMVDYSLHKNEPIVFVIEESICNCKKKTCKLLTDFFGGVGGVCEKDSWVSKHISQTIFVYLT